MFGECVPIDDKIDFEYLFHMVNFMWAALELSFLQTSSESPVFPLNFHDLGSTMLFGLFLDVERACALHCIAKYAFDVAKRSYILGK